MKKILALLLVTVICVGLCGCLDSYTDPEKKGSKPSKPTTSTTASALPNAPEKPAFVPVGESGSRTDDKIGFQLDLPKVGEEIAVIETSMGDVYIRLFEKSAPLAVTNFKGLIKAGYYNNLIFHRVINDFMIQGGDPTGTGYHGDSVWGYDFEDEFNQNLLNLRGALSMANSGANTNGSQFFIVQKKSIADVISQMEASGYPKETVELYKNNGGTPWLDGAHTVFGQVFVGMDVVDAIAGVKVDADDKPIESVYIKNARLTEVTQELLDKAGNTIVVPGL